MSVDKKTKSRKSSLASSLRGYEGDAGLALAARYEAIDPENLHADILDSLPSPPASVIDIGAGSGRDAEWFVSKDYRVVAVEPSETMLKEGRRLHPDPRIIWIEDSLPALSEVYRCGASFDVAMLSAVWMHIPANRRELAFRRVVNLLKPDGVIVMRVKTKPVEAERGMHPVCIEEIKNLARDYGGVFRKEHTSEDLLARSDTSWCTLVIKFPDNDGRGALPLLRHVILKDAKTGTHKFGLLQSVLMAADGSQGFASVSAGEKDEVKVPLGLVALNWLRLYKPMLKENLPQARKNTEGVKGLGFSSDGWKVLEDTVPFDFRPGALFGCEQAKAVHDVLRKISANIVKHPARYMTYPGTSKRIMRVNRRSPGRAPAEIVMDEEYLQSFGDIRVPLNVWHAMASYSVWIEPALFREWGRMIEIFAERQGRKIRHKTLVQSMRRTEPSRATEDVHDRVRELIESGRKVYCVWTGTPVRESSFEVDHCLPWAVWPCGDLWNLMPTLRSVNNEKRAFLPTAKTLEKGMEHIIEWWRQAWFENPAMRCRFMNEAEASLLMPQCESYLDSVFGGLLRRRNSILSNQAVEEWAPKKCRV